MSPRSNGPPCRAPFLFALLPLGLLKRGLLFAHSPRSPCPTMEKAFAPPGIFPGLRPALFKRGELEREVDITRVPVRRQPKSTGQWGGVTRGYLCSGMFNPGCFYGNRRFPAKAGCGCPAIVKLSPADPVLAPLAQRTRNNLTRVDISLIRRVRFRRKQDIITHLQNTGKTVCEDLLSPGDGAAGCAIRISPSRRRLA